MEYSTHNVSTYLAAELNDVNIQLLLVTRITLKVKQWFCNLVTKINTTRVH